MMFAYSPEEEERKGNARVFDMETGNDFRLAFGHVEWRPVRFRDS